MKLLIVRNDKLGDFVLSLPVFSLLKTYLPDCELHALVPKYTSEIALQSDWIDDVILDPGTSAPLSSQIDLLKKIRTENYDAAITLFSTTRLGILLALSGIKYRLAPATKIAQIFYNHKVTQRRSKSLKPEYKYNLDLAAKFLFEKNIVIKVIPPPPYIHFQDMDMNSLREDFFRKNTIKSSDKLIFIHPGTGGSATNLSLQQYADLAKYIYSDNDLTFVITAGPSEIKYAKQLSSLLTGIPHIVYHSTAGLIEFSKIIQLCHLFISASTGPLHIAGALNRPTAAFYQRRRSATPLRWQTLNTKDKRLAFTPPDNEHESDLGTIDIKSAANKIKEKFLFES